MTAIGGANGGGLLRHGFDSPPLRVANIKRRNRCAQQKPSMFFFRRRDHHQAGGGSGCRMARRATVTASSIAALVERGLLARLHCRR